MDIWRLDRDHTCPPVHIFIYPQGAIISHHGNIIALLISTVLKMPLQEATPNAKKTTRVAVSKLKAVVIARESLKHA